MAAVLTHPPRGNVWKMGSVTILTHNHAVDER